MIELWEIVKSLMPGVVAAVLTITPLIVATIKILRAVRDNRTITNKLENVNTKIDGLIDLISLDYANRKSVSPLEKQAMTELAQKVRGGGKIDGAMVATETKQAVEKLATVVEAMSKKPAPVIDTVQETLPEGFIDPEALA